MAINPNDTDAISGRAYILRRQGHWEEAAELLERVLAFSPRDSDTSYTLGRTYRSLRDFQKAKKYAELTISLFAMVAIGGMLAIVAAVFNTSAIKSA